MKKHFAAPVAIILMAAFAVSAIQAQELVYEQRENQVSYDGNVSYAAVAFNGKDLAAFYYWTGISDEGSGLYMRRIGTDGKPFGPQRLILERELILGSGAESIAAVWDGSAYVVFASDNFGTVTWNILRVDVMGNRLGYRQVPVQPRGFHGPRIFPFVVDGRIYFYFSSLKSYFAETGYPFLITADSELKEKPVLTRLSGGGPQQSTILGVALDPDKFVVYFGQRRYFADKILKEWIQHFGFDAKVKKTIKPSIFLPGGSTPAEGLNSLDQIDVAGPVYMGDGYLMIGNRHSLNRPPNSWVYTNSSLKIDDTGQIIEGPYDLGNEGNYVYMGIPELLGGYVGLPITDTGIADNQVMFIGKRGKHIRDVSVHEYSDDDFTATSVKTVYIGTGTATVAYGIISRFDEDQNFRIYSNIITEPKFVKPAIVYFNGSSGKPFGDTRRLVMWSVAGATSVTLTGPDFELTNLPPVYHHVVDTKGERTRLRLTIVGTDGSRKTKRLVLEP